MHKKTVFIFILILLSGFVRAQDDAIPNPMSPPSLVNDFAGVFDPSQKNELEQILRAYNDSTSTQIYVVTVADLHGYDVADFAYRVGEKWGVGQKSKNNGAVILIKPKTSNSRGQVYIAVGYGLEPILNDARIGRIIDQRMIPHLQNNDYFGAAQSATYAMIQYLSGQFDADAESDGGKDIALIFVIILIFMIAIIISTKKNGGNGGSSGSGGGGFFPPVFPGGGRSGSGSSGGFGGGGGGSFGGGGAGRSW